MSRRHFLLSLFITIVTACMSQIPARELSWKNSSIQGRALTVYTIFKDSRGLVWLGTDNGLYFYDGNESHSVGKDKIGEFHIYAIAEKDSVLFIGTNNGLFVYDLENGELKNYEIVTPGEIRSMLLSGDDLWIGSLYGIFAVHLNDATIEDFSSGLPSPSVYSILRDSRGILYAGTYNGLARWDSIDHTFNSIPLKDITKREGLFINSLIESEDRRSLLIGGENTLYKYTPSLDSWEKSELVKGFNVKSLTQSRDGHLIMGTDAGVMDLYKDTIKQYRHDSRQPQTIGHNEIWTVFCDENNNIWAGHERGFSIASNSEIIKSHNLGQLTGSGESNEIHSILRDSNGNLWLGGSNGLIYLSHGNHIEWFRHSDSLNSLSHNRVRAIMESKEGDLYLATDGGLNLFKGKDGFKAFHIVDSTGNYNANWSYTLTEKDDEILIGSFLGGILGVNKSDLQKGNQEIKADFAINSSTNPSLRNDLVNTIVNDKEGNFWVLLFRDNALVKFDKEMNKIAEFDIYEITDGYPSHLIKDKKGRIWCGFKGGVIKFEEGEKPYTISLDKTTADETIIAMADVGDDIWLSTRSNLWKIDGDNYKVSILPIPQKGYTAIYDDTPSGNVLLGGVDELMEIDVSNIGSADDFRKVRLILEETEEGKWRFFIPYSVSQKLKLKHGGSLTLLLSTLNYTPDVQPRFMYKLGDSKTDTVGDWHILPEGSNKISLSDLKMGKYHLMVKSEGESQVAFSIPLEVESPPALSWWAITLYSLILVMIIAGIIWLLNRKRRNDLEKQRRETELRNVERKLSFLSTISHDLKTPLSLILGPVSILKEKTTDKETRKSLNGVYESAKKLGKMIQQSIELQQMEIADESFLTISRFDIVDFCKGILDTFEDNNKNKKFYFQSSQHKITIEADAVKLESIVTNLLSNACKYSFEGSVISMSVAEEGNEVRVTVSDDGIGISDDDRPKIFHKMYRSPLTLSTKEGSGLGLYLIKRYLEMMKGRVELDSKINEGTTFSIYLPRAEGDSSEKYGIDSSADGSRPIILVVEDNPEISEFIKEILTPRYNVMAAPNGRSGLAVAASVRPDLIILDEMMPVMTGLEMAKKLKENQSLVATPVIMLTAKTDNTTETESIKNGVDIFMGKPFDPSTLIGRIEQLLKGRKEIKDKVRMQTLLQNETKPIEAESVNEKMIANVIRIIEENLSDPDFNVDMLSKKAGISTKNLYRILKKYMEKAPLEFIREIRLKKAAQLLKQKRFTVSEICYMVGFKTPSYFTKCFQNAYGVTPSEYSEKE